MSGLVLKHGKVRDIYQADNQQLLITTSDRISAFDRVLTEIPGKGAVLNQLSAWWFAKTRHIIDNHFIALASSNSMRVKQCEVVPVEVVVRGYLTGSTSTSILTLYEQGQREFFTTHLPDGLLKNSPLPHPTLTPTSKSEQHDQPLTASEITETVGADLWEQISDAALKLFAFGQQVAAHSGLILVDTKYEFGVDQSGQLMLIDELHTPDSSRYWDAKDYQAKIDAGQQPEPYDKEMLRLWFRANCDPYADEVLPDAPQELIQAVAKRYQSLYQKLTHQCCLTEDQITQGTLCAE